jgi:Flp pilus assembly protein TadG
MKLQLIRDDTRGSTLVEFTVTLPIFLSVMFGLVQVGLLFWAQLGLQHGVEMAARCASVNDAAVQIGASTSCFSTTLAPTAVTKSTIQSYAAQNSYGLNPAASTFDVKTPAQDNWQCANSVDGNRVSVVSAGYTFNLINYIFSLKFHAQSCYPSPI